MDTKLSYWFGLSYASFLTMPRVLMEAMPEKWQNDMAELLSEYDDTFVSWPEGLGTRVQCTQNGKLVKFPSWVLDYRHPDIEEIDKLRTVGK